ncbi:hypothetical protein TW65_01346 [Stemphylium lycopersici]|nr:hypothetical protein TW65_01346 [Stemphylium lycopersici]
MKEKLKAVLHMRKRSSPPQSPRASYEQSEHSSPRAEHHPTSPRQRHPPASSSSHTPSPRASDTQHPKATHQGGPVTRSAAPLSASSSSSSPSSSSSDSQSKNVDPNGSIADNYRSYLPVLAPAGEPKTESRKTNHHGPIADADTLKPLPAIPGRFTKVDQFRMQDIDWRADASVHETREQPIGSALTTKDNITEGAHAHNVESQNRNVPHDMAVKPLNVASKREYAGMEAGNDWKLKQKSMLKGVVDLKNTVDTDREITWAPAVTHEVIKPHEHEVIQQQIHREIHNYTYYHRLQPVLQTEVLPPRHFIPNPDGEGLIEISADELPARTGKNRWWDIVQKETALPETPFEWRTEPQIIEGKPYVTEEGFERRETTIIYPPTLEDMSNYPGMVQPVHFDHKTGRRWLGEITTVEKLRTEVAGTNEEGFMAMEEVTAHLPGVASSPSVKRKPVGRDSL